MTSKVAPLPPGNKIDKEVAELEFDRWSDCMELDLDTSAMDAEALDSFLKLKRRLIKNICTGSLVIDGNGKAVYMPKNLKLETALTFNQKNGAALQAMDGKKNNQDIAKTYAVMAALTKTHPSTFAKMEGNDLSVCMGLFLLLMD